MSEEKKEKTSSELYCFDDANDETLNQWCKLLGIEIPSKPLKIVLKKKDDDIEE
ncbi:MAG: hypothetical protein IJD51_00885 [Clostridia bacterium]|nr:hypothetical protein [Clostridia bacterium]